MTRLVLASASPRRRELLALLGVPFTVVAPNIDERAAASPARAKANKVAERGSATLAADTEIDLDGERLGKPRDPADAAEMLARLAGRDHEVVEVCRRLQARGQRVVVAGLDRDYRRAPFGPMPELLAHADEVSKLKAVCHSCGEPAGTTST